MCRLSSMAWTSFSGSLWRGNTSQRPSTIGIQTSTIWIVASFSSYRRRQSHYVLTVCDNAKQSCPVFFGRLCACITASEIRPAVEGTSEIRLGAFRKVRDELLGCWTEGLRYQQE